MKTVLVTGATDGIGKETARRLAEKGWRIIVHGRTKARCEQTASFIRNSTGNAEVDFVCADLASFSEIKKMAQEIRDRYANLNVLLNNAGVFEAQEKYSRDGIERTFAVNHLSHFLLTGLLLDPLKRSGAARIVTVSSMAHASAIDFSTLSQPKSYSGYEAYSTSKLANILFTFRLAEKLAGSGISANCLHPGVINTKLLQAGWGMGGGSVHDGAETSLFLAASPEVEQVTGHYFSNGRISNPAPIAYDRETQTGLWRLSETLCEYAY